MQLQIDNLGKVSITVEEDYWDITKDYDKLTIVEKEGIFGTFISRKPVPAGTVLTNREYWIPFSSLKENIILDYNSFKDTYDNTIKEHTASLKDIIIRLNELEENKELIEELINTANNALNESNSSLKEIKEIKTNIESIANSIPNDVVIDVKAVNNNNSDLLITHHNLKTKTVDTVFQEIPRLTALYDKIEKPNGLATLDSNNELKITQHKVLSDINPIGVIGKNPKEYEVENGGKLNIKRITKIEYSELVNLRNNGQLIPGMWYELLDYTATTIQDNTSSTDHAFDILLLATSNNTLSEEARASRYYEYVGGNEDQDYYPSDTKFEAWKIWYCLDNDTSRFFWADEENGKGVIYRMIDEFGNDCPYDFKSILFKNVYNGIYQYTFNTLPDESIDQSMYGPKNNKITPFITTIEVDYKSKTVQLLNNIILYVNSEFTLQNVLPWIWTDEYANNRIENNTFINCYNSIIIKPENNFIINSSLKLISVCVDNNIHDCIFDIKHGEDILEWNDGLCLFRNDIKKSTIHKNAWNAHKKTPNAITFSNIFKFADDNDRLGHIYIDGSNINLFRVESSEESEGNIDIQLSYIFDTSIFTEAEGCITINESTISNSCINSVFRQEYGDYIDIIIDKSKITNVIDGVLYALYNSSIQNSNYIVCAEEIYDSNIQNSEGLICLDYIYDSNICNVTNTTLNVDFEHADIKSIDDYGDISDVDLNFSTVYEDRNHQLLIDKR